MVKGRRAGLFINLAVLLAAVAVPVTAVALLCVGFAASYSRKVFGPFLFRLLCLAADAAPILLLSSLALLLLAYHPYAHPFQDGATREQVLAAAGVTHTLPYAAGHFVFNVLYISERYYFWLGVTAALSLVLLLLLYRMVPKRRRS